MPSYDRAKKLYPLGEFWLDGRPFMYLGASSSSKGSETYIYDLENRKEITVKGELYNLELFGKKIEGHEWPESFVSKL